MDSVGEGEGGMIWENGIETYIISYMKPVASPGSMHDTGCLGLVLGRRRGTVWGGTREKGSGWGTRVYLWQIHVDIWQNLYNIVKLKKKKKNQFHPETVFLSPICSLSPTKLARYPTNTVGYTVLYCNKFIILFT